MKAVSAAHPTEIGVLEVQRRARGVVSGPGFVIEDQVMYRGLVEAIGLGAMHGIATFLPVSLNGHIALAEMLFELPASGALEQMGLSVGTMVATLVIVRQPLRDLLVWLCRPFRRRDSSISPLAGRDLMTIGLAQIPRWLLEAWFSDGATAFSRQPWLVAVGLLVTAVVLMSTAWIGRAMGNTLTSLQALVLGLVLAIGILPGISLLGCVLVAGMWLGLTERRSFELALLVAIPSMIGSTIGLGRTAFVGGAALGGSVESAVLGFLVAMLVGLLSAKTLQILSEGRRIAWFALWLMPLSIATFAFARAWPGV